MKQMVYRWLVGIVAVMIVVHLVRLIGLKLTWPDFWGVIIFIPVLALVNAIIGNLLRMLSLPLTCLTLGLFGFIINALVFWIAGEATGADMTFLSALLGSILYGVVSTPLNWVIKERNS